MPEPLLEAKEIVKSFGRVRALRGASFSVYPKEVVALVGDNGAGKSTLVKTLAGVHQPDSGQILFEGQPVDLHTPLDARRLGIETVYQDLALAAELDAGANMFLGREVMRPCLLGRVDRDRLALEEDLAAVGRVDADKRLDQRRLAGAVVADERDDLLGKDREVRAVERLDAAERLDDLARFEDGLGTHQVASAVGSGGRQRRPSTPCVSTVPAA